MAVCNFFLQGRCRFGEKCWNEHPRDGRHQAPNRYQQQQPPQYAGDSRSTSWSAGNQKYVQPSSFPKSSTWTNRDNANKTAYGSFSGSGDSHRNTRSNASSGFSQNHYAVLGAQDHAKSVPPDREGNVMDEIFLDMDTWESSGQWRFSVYYVMKEKGLLAGFTDISPEEMRLECYSSQKDGTVQNYVNSVQQLVNQWQRRIQEIRNINPASKSQLLNEITRPSVNPPTFGGQQKSAFGSSSFPASNALSAFSFKPESLSDAPKPVQPNFPSAPAFGSTPAMGFGTVTPDSFSFAKTAHSNSGASVFPGFGSSSTGANMSSSTGTTVHTGFGSSANSASTFGGSSGFSASGNPAGTPAASSFPVNSTGVSSTTGAASSAPGTSIFGQVASTSMTGTPSNIPGSLSDTCNVLFTLQTDLSSEDLLQFTSKRFTLGRIPLLPPPVELLNV